MKKAMKIKVINRSAYALPQYETAGAAGMDVRADIRESIVLGPLERTLVPAPDYEESARRGSNGLRLSLFLGRHAQNRPGSSGKYDKKTTAGKGQLGSIV